MTNVWVKKIWTNRGSVSLLRFVQVFLTQTLENAHFTTNSDALENLNYHNFRYTLMMLEPEQKSAGVIAASAGNHALALAYHGGQLSKQTITQWYQFRCWILKMIDPKKQNFWPKINILKGNHCILRKRGAPVLKNRTWF